MTGQISAPTSRAGPPGAAGCRGTGIGDQASLWIRRNSGPQQIAIGKAAFKQIFSAERSACGQV